MKSVVAGLQTTPIMRVLNINENEKRKQATIKGLISHVEEKISEPVTAGKQEYFSTFSMRGAVCGDLTARYSRQILTAIFFKNTSYIDADILTK